ncbi:RNA polymerase sigma factor region1.1 domain-containing protein [Acetivibrio ethanolgignens]|uniref:RNA polymerase sigma-70 domain-containing protein n=1 Tax=Acetivibrio ethanolgignens TaxID=290052 RepID=A0A0V8QEL7_9FIRM|nr:RNA polymerase sigma factor region1.1 domain-containing protein [Acetivibrio ethanolgignens]KSV58983.1 hypothetical protein ASU35_10520 [Acetivibrio ethanolgignens]
MERMLEKGKFLDMLGEILEIAKTQGGSLSQEEIQEYFKGMELTKEHMDAIYAYLSENKITVKGVLYTPSQKNAEAEQNEADSIYLTMYLEDLAGIAPEEPGEAEQLYLRMRGGEEAARVRLTEVWLSRVVELARGYQNQGVFIEDLIQEGNIGLLSGIEALMERQEHLAAEEYLKESVCQHMENLIDAAMGEDDLENTVLAKTNLISEAAKVLAEDMGRVATLEELADYTKIPMEEIGDILNLSLDAVKVGEGEHHHHH